MEVNVVDDACARDPAEVPARVVALRGIRLGERAHARRGHPVQLDDFVLGEVAELADMPHRGDHEVAGRVRVLVEQGDRPLSAAENEPGFVVTLDRCAEDTARALVGRLDVLEPPGRPELLHTGASIKGR
jgi:hypothetical protein